MKAKINKMRSSKESVVLDMIRKYGHISRPVAETMGIKSLSSTINRLRNKGWGFTARSANHPNIKRKSVLIYTFTERQLTIPFSPIYNEKAPKHSRYHHKF